MRPLEHKSRPHGYGAKHPGVSDRRRAAFGIPLEYGNGSQSLSQSAPGPALAHESPAGGSSGRFCRSMRHCPVLGSGVAPPASLVHPPLAEKESFQVGYEGEGAIPVCVFQ